jgi:hypothetical protein
MSRPEPSRILLFLREAVCLLGGEYFTERDRKKLQSLGFKSGKTLVRRRMLIVQRFSKRWKLTTLPPSNFYRKKEVASGSPFYWGNQGKGRPGLII